MNRVTKLLLLCLVTVFLFSSCLPGDGKNAADKRAGFWMGLWHGIVAPISLIVQIFNPAIRVYEVHNTGFWYDLGFWLTLAGGAGSGAAASKRRRRAEQA